MLSALRESSGRRPVHRLRPSTAQGITDNFLSSLVDTLHSLQYIHVPMFARGTGKTTCKSKPYVRVLTRALAIGRSKGMQAIGASIHGRGVR